MHPLEEVIQKANGFLLIGDSSQERFPAMSFHSYTSVGKKFYCLDLGGMTTSRGKTRGEHIYTDVADLPDDLGTLAVIWVKPRTAARAVELAHEAGCTSVWFSFKTGHRDAVKRARELELDVVEIGRCPVHYMDAMAPECKAHTALLKVTGSWKKPPQTDPDAKRRELF